MVSELIRKYIWVLQILIKAGPAGLSLGQILRRWEDRWDAPYNRRTFNNHREAILEIFGIEIRCDRSTNRYYVPAGEDVSNTDAAAAWLINTFTVNNLLTLGRERLSGRVSVEDVPSGQRWLTLLMDAMTDNQTVRILYRKYTREEAESLHVHPYAVKEFHRRWYLVGWCEERQAERVYGLDRILDMVPTQERFRMPEGYDVDEVFAESLGIYLPEGRKAENILFRATEKEARYLRDLPLHFSQTELETDLFQIRLIVTDDLVMEFCRLGDRVEVLAPASLRDRIARELVRAAGLYAPTHSSGTAPAKSNETAPAKRNETAPAKRNETAADRDNENKI